jgi:hypothetical protein
MITGPSGKGYAKGYDLEKWREPSIRAMEAVLGRKDDREYHAPIFFDAGAELGGAPDIIKFSSQGNWIAYATSELIGRDNQVRNSLGNYELMICLPREFEDHWATDILTVMAYHTLAAALNPGETTDIGNAPQGSSITGLLLSEYARFPVHDRPCGLLLCIGITELEMQFCHQKPWLFSRAKGPAKLEKMLKQSSTYPVTDFYRPSLV